MLYVVSGHSLGIKQEYVVMMWGVNEASVGSRSTTFFGLILLGDDNHVNTTKTWKMNLIIEKVHIKGRQWKILVCS